MRRPTACSESTQALREALAQFRERGLTAEVVAALRRATDGLYTAPDPAALPDLRVAYGLHSAGPQANWVRVWALRALIRSGGARVRPVILAATAKDFWRLRMLAARALAHDAQATALLIGLTRDPQWRVRDAACRSLGHGAATGEVMDALGMATNDPDGRVIATAERALDGLRVKNA